ncbi:hypothetical protein DCCM_3068 [Desulfocucumis palustris]|uniref:Vitamin K epoxide reductase domain-containing protein n=1 Tax=Desulfocucumis palustris TaxID=1898651 RepID=A0A2L2XC96_9FIRM|nr:hypothetical protein [Desulfocucumis palustris]GBF33957.1 hypothetical protein DCCM_3068 [Desulfocucumis palustris]
MRKYIPVLFCLFGLYESLSIINCELCRSKTLLNIPLEIWGATFFGITALLFLSSYKKTLKIALSVWFLAHMAVIIYFGIMDKYLCSSCMILAGVEGILLILAFSSDEDNPVNTSIVQVFSVFLLIIMAAIPAGKAVMAAASNAAYGQISKMENISTESQKNIGLAPAAKDMKIYDENGKEVPIKSGTKVLFFAWWCPHCKDALLENKDMVKVSTYFKKDADNILETKEKLKDLNIPADKCYYLPDNPPVKKVPEVYQF